MRRAGSCLMELSVSMTADVCSFRLSERMLMLPPLGVPPVGLQNQGSWHPSVHPEKATAFLERRSLVGSNISPNIPGSLCTLQPAPLLPSRHLCRTHSGGHTLPILQMRKLRLRQKGLRLKAHQRQNWIWVSLSHTLILKV